MFREKPARPAPGGIMLLLWLALVGFAIWWFVAGARAGDGWWIGGSSALLAGQTAEIAEELKHEIQARIEKAGVQVLEARISHLAYAPEIAGAMLRRQQASTVIAARQKIVEGAVGMVEMALDGLARKQVVQLDEERKAAMVTNLLVVLRSEHGTQPVLNAGTLDQ